MKRRDFLKAGVAASAMLAAPGALGANDRIVVAIMGIHDRGMDLARECVLRDDVEIRYLVDPDSRLFRKNAKLIEDVTGKAPQCLQDFRVALDDPDVDAVIIATPDHWHALATIMACQAGKDVYVEKPTSHSVWESRQMVEAARKYKRVVQVGTQNRSADYCHQAMEYLQSKNLGDIHLIRIMNSKKRDPLPVAPDQPAPKGVDYDMWLGPAPKRPFNENHFHYKWHWFWDYSGGDAFNDGVHQIDLARWVSGKMLPNCVTGLAANHVLKDGRETPDTQNMTWAFDDMTMVFEQTLWTPYMKKHPFDLRDTDTMPTWPFAGTRIEVYGTKQFMFFGRMGGGFQVIDGDGNTVKLTPGKFSPANTKHVANFIECIRSRKRPNADIEEGHYSTLLAHYGNIACRTGRTLQIDPDTEGILNDTDANALIRRNYREPWVVPEKV